VVSAKNAWSSLSSVLKVQRREIGDVAFSVRTQPLSEHHHRDRLALDDASSMAEIVSGASAELGAALAEAASSGPKSRELLSLARDLDHARLLTEQDLDPLQLVAEILVLGADSNFPRACAKTRKRMFGMEWPAIR